MSIVFAHAAFLDAAQCFALLPMATLLRRTGNEDAAILNFNLERQSATLTANRPYRSAAKLHASWKFLQSLQSLLHSSLICLDKTEGIGLRINKFTHVCMHTLRSPVSDYNLLFVFFIIASFAYELPMLKSLWFRKGDLLAMYDGRPNGELFLATGTVEDRNPSDCLLFKAELIKADRLFSSKKAIVESLGFSTSEVTLSHTLRRFAFTLKTWESLN